MSDHQLVMRSRLRLFGVLYEADIIDMYVWAAPKIKGTVPPELIYCTYTQIENTVVLLTQNKACNALFSFDAFTSYSIYSNSSFLGNINYTQLTDL